MSHIALFQFPWQQMSVQPSRNIHHLGWVRPPWDIRTWEFWKYEKLGKKCSTSIYWTRGTVEKEVYSEISLNFSFRNRREKWFTKSPGTKGGDPSPPNTFKKDISQSSALPLHHFASSAWMKCTNATRWSGLCLLHTKAFHGARCWQSAAENVKSAPEIEAFFRLLQFTITFFLAA